MKTSLKLTGILAVVTAVCLFSAFKLKNSDNEPTTKATTTSVTDDNELIGAGATFPYPFYSKLFDEYNKATGVKVNYQSVGSGAGIQQLKSKTVDFGASDAFMSDDDIKSMPAPVIHIPTCLGSIVISYNIPGNPIIKFTPDIVAGIFLGTITKWNDAAIIKVNPGIKIPALPITVAHRSDGSGTTAGFTDYLAKVSTGWKTKVGAGKSVNWPVGVGGKGNAGVAGLISQTPGSVGYVELIYAVQNKMTYGALQNKSGKFINASLESTKAAGDIKLPADLRVSITNTDAADGYPICSFTYILLYKDLSTNVSSLAKAKNVLKLISWMIHDGQKLASPLDYAPLPDAAVKQADAILKGVTFQGKPLM
jgi:phosphate transport system substrate-binding protein